jgi:putative DNA primase/helicase
MEPLTTIAPELSPEAITRIEAETRTLMNPAESSSNALEPSPPEEKQTLEIMPNDSEHARQFVGFHGHRFRYIFDLKSWLVWDETAGWVPAIEPDILEVARDYVDDQIAASLKAMEGGDDDDARKAMKAAAKYGDASKLHALIYLTKSDPKIIASILDIDADPWRAGVANGSIKLTTGEFQKPDRAYLVTKRLACSYDPRATCPTWDSFMAKVQPDPEVRAMLKRWAGYCLTGSVQEQKFVFFHGGGSNGKSTFLETIKFLFGGYAQGAPDKLIMTNPRGNDHANEVARLPGVRFLLGCEVGETAKLNEELVKAIVSGDTVTGEPKFCTSFDFKSSAKLNLFGNHRPIVSGTDHGFWRKILLVPWPVKIQDSEKDKTLPDRLKLELPGILNWCLEGLADWRDRGLSQPRCIDAATAEYRSDSDLLGDFLTDHIDTAADGCRLTKPEVYKRYREWAEEGGIRMLWSSKTFNAKMKDRGIEEGRSNGAKIWKGLGWISNF